MRRKIVLAITIIVCFLLQCTVFKALAIASISPNLLIVVVASFGFMRGKKEGLFVGFFAGLLLDVMFGSVIGFYALIYMYIPVPAISYETDNNQRKICPGTRTGRNKSVNYRKNH